MGGDSNLRHVVHRRVHLERHQPKHRKGKGYLEKHKDYVKRAKNHHAKQDEIKALQRKAYFKNPDEFNHSMVSHTQEQDGKVFKKRDKPSADELRLLDTQDAHYVGMRELMDRRAVARAKETLHFLEAERPNTHTIFVDDEDLVANAGSSVSSSGGCHVEAQRLTPGGGTTNVSLQGYDLAKHFDTHPALLGRKANRPRLSQLQSSSAFAKSKGTEHMLKRSYTSLFAHQERSKKLGTVREKLQLRSDLRGKGRRMKVKEGANGKADVYRWLPKRKR